MTDYKLPFSVFTLDRQELLPAGTFLTEQTMAEVAALGRMQEWEEIELLEHGTVKSDLARFLKIPPYHEIFEEEAVVAELFTWMGQVRLPSPLLKALDYFRQNDFHTYRHILMVFTMSSMLVKEVYRTGAPGDSEIMAGPTHDFGKLCVPLHILKKNSPLTIREREILSYHPMAGYVLLSYYLKDHNHLAAIVARDHHERRNGSGYPRGQKEMQPLVEMVAACDVYDALISPRPYRPLSFDNRSALEELTRMAEDGELGWECVERLVACNRIGRPTPARVIVSKDKRGTVPAGNCYGMTVEENTTVAVKVGTAAETL